MKIIASLLSVFVIFAASNAMAEIYIAPGYFVLNDELTNSGSTVTTEITYLNIRAGYKMNDLLFGAIYHSEDYGNSSELTGFGASFGYHPGNGFFLMASYILDSEYTSGATTFTKGTGFVLDFGYLQEITGNFSFGPNLFYRSLSWSETSAGATADVERTGYVPSLLFMFKF